MKNVTPNLESVPERTYEHDGSGIVICYAATIGSGFLNNDITKGPELWRIVLGPDNADKLMEDLYYGEYTGG